MNRLSITLVMVALVGSLATMQATYNSRHHGVQQTPKHWTCTWEQAEDVKLNADGTQTVLSWKETHSKHAVTAKTQEEAKELCQKQAGLLSSHIQTRNWKVHNVTGK